MRHVVHPPVREVRFWVVQAMVVLIAGIHLLVDLHSPVEAGAFPAGTPVALLVIPVGYAALRYGLSGSAATGVWATLLWLPDLLLPHDQGHVGGDIVDLALVDVVAFFFGQRIEAERLAHARVERSTAEQLAVETRYQQLFETNRAPILVLDAKGTIVHANPAATSLFGKDAVGQAGEPLFRGRAEPGERVEQVLRLSDGRYYRVNVASLPPGTGRLSTQVVLEDVTEERSTGERATRYAQLLVQAEEEQRRRLARELHDEPLQLFLYLARRLQSLGAARGVPAEVSGGLVEARQQALDAAGRLRTLARDLRPPTLDRLGFVAALSSLVADVEEEAGLLAELEVTGDEARLPPDVELGAYRVVEEAVRNTVRHAGAHQLHVTVSFGSGALVLVVADDGRGFSPEGIGGIGGIGSDHLGLLGMGERVRLFGGHLEVRSQPGEGTVLEATFPFPPPAPGPAKADP